VNFAQFTLRDWLIFCVPYLVWCLVWAAIWRTTLRERITRPAFRAAAFAILFTPTLFPIVREAFILGPASVSFLFVGLMALRSPGAGRLLMAVLVGGDLVPMVLVWALYRFGVAPPRQRSRSPNS
jgi:hypothetical protein